MYPYPLYFHKSGQWTKMRIRLLVGLVIRGVRELYNLEGPKILEESQKFLNFRFKQDFGFLGRSITHFINCYVTLYTV
jgi:hypothetical protein